MHARAFPQPRAGVGQCELPHPLAVPCPRALPLTRTKRRTRTRVCFPGPLRRRLRERVQRALLTRKPLSYTAQHLSVRVHKGDVTLQGRVRTEREMSEVEKLVKLFAGVRHVRNEVALVD